MLFLNFANLMAHSGQIKKQKKQQQKKVHAYINKFTLTRTSRQQIYT